MNRIINHPQPSTGFRPRHLSGIRPGESVLRLSEIEMQVLREGDLPGLRKLSHAITIVVAGCFCLAAVIWWLLLSL